MALWRPTLVVAVLLSAVLIGGSPEVQAVPKSTPYFPPAMFEGIETPGSTFDMVLTLVDYERGAYSGSETASYQRFFTVMEGRLFVHIGNKTSLFQAGQKFSVPAGSSVRLNNGGSEKARIYVSELIGPGTDKLQVVPGTGPSSPAPRVLYTSRMTMRDIPNVVTLVQVGSRFEPGFATGVHVMNHPHAMLHLEGLTTYRYVDGNAETYAAGEGGEMYPGQAGLMSNGGADMSGFLITWLQTPGTPLTTPVDQKVPSWTTPGPSSPASTGGSISPPNTGDGGLVMPFQANAASRSSGWLAPVLVIIVAAIWLPGVGRRSQITSPKR